MPGEHSVAIDSTGRRITIIVMQMPGVPVFYDFVGMGIGEDNDKGIFTTTTEIAKGMLGFYAGFESIENGNKGSFYRGVFDSKWGPNGGDVKSEQDFHHLWNNSVYTMEF